MAKTLTIQHKHGSYPVHIAQSIESALQQNAKQGGIFGQGLPEGIDKVVLVSTEPLASLLQDEMAVIMERFGAEATPILIADGEQSKSLTQAEKLWEELARRGLTRSSLLLAFGGGVVTDLVGYVAACYMRGIDYVSIPTSLLAQTDAALGGKTGVNLTAGKNLVGCFYPPLAVLNSISVLRNLPQKEVANGYAEIIKHALLANREFFIFLEECLAKGAPTDLSEELTAEILYRSCSVKVDIVCADEREQLTTSGRRMLLNLGHTFAHALEARTGYKGLAHGQAVARGLCMAAGISKQIGQITSAEIQRITAMLTAAGLPTDLPHTNEIEDLLRFMLHDKKKMHSGVPLILLRSIGDAYIAGPYTREQIGGMLWSLLS